jgi:hypothetical protein
MNKKEEKMILKLIIWLMMCLGCLYFGYQLSEANIYHYKNENKETVMNDLEIRKYSHYYCIDKYNKN